MGVWHGVIFSRQYLIKIVRSMREPKNTGNYRAEIPIEKLRLAPGGGGGQDRTRRTRSTAARSSAALPEAAAKATFASRPLLSTLNDTRAVPRPRTLGRPERDTQDITRPG